MSLTYLDATTLGDALSCAWKKDLNTSQDPANGKWYAKGANGDSIGLYGGLTDSVPSNVTLDTAKATYTTVAEVAASETVDNRDGLADNAQTLKLTYNIAQTTSESHSTTESVTEGQTFQIKVNEEVAEESASFSVSFTFSSTETETQTNTTSTSAEADVPVTVPAGKVYDVQIWADVQTLTVPYTLKIEVTGTTETWFESTVNGHYNYAASAGEAFSWIKQYDCAGSTSDDYSNSGTTGTITVSGTVTVSQNVNFTTKIVDITDTYTGP